MTINNNYHQAKVHVQFVYMGLMISVLLDYRYEACTESVNPENVVFLQLYVRRG